MAYHESIEHQEHSIVALGKFNPQIFSPTWLALEGLISKQEALDSNTKLSARGISIFTTGWFNMEVTDERFKVSTNQNSYFAMLRDLTQGIFTILGHTPVRALGLNFNCHLRCYDKNDLDKLLQGLAPLSAWSSFLQSPTLERFAIRQTFENCLLRVAIEKSTTVENGVFIDVNNHYELIGDEVWRDETGQRYIKASYLPDLISANYDTATKRSDETISHIWSSK